MSTEPSLELATRSAVDIENLGSDQDPTSPSNQLGNGGEIFKDFTLFEKRVPQDFTWSGVNFKVGSKQILSDCWGNVPSGKVCAIMGSSGAGKVRYHIDTSYMSHDLGSLLFLMFLLDDLPLLATFKSMPK